MVNNGKIMLTTLLNRNVYYINLFVIDGMGL